MTGRVHYITVMSSHKHSPSTVRFTSAEAPSTVHTIEPLSSRSTEGIVSPNEEGLPLIAAGDPPVKTGCAVDPTHGIRALVPSEIEREGGGARMIPSISDTAVSEEKEKMKFLE